MADAEMIVPALDLRAAIPHDSAPANHALAMPRVGEPSPARAVTSPVNSSSIAAPAGLALFNDFILQHVRAIEMVGVLMRIFSFSLVSWLGPQSPFLFVWVFNTIDAVILSWCAVLKRDAAYTTLNLFWILVGLVGIARTLQWIG